MNSPNRMRNRIGNECVTTVLLIRPKMSTNVQKFCSMSNKSNELVTSFCYALKAVKSNG